MHEPFSPTCGVCRKFMYCYGKGSLLSDWGYCLDEVGDAPPTPERLRWIEEQAEAGNYDALLKAAKSLYQVSDDGCEHYEHESGVHF